MNIPEISVKRPVFMLMVILIIIIIGIVAFSKLTIDLMPKIDYPLTTVVTTYEGVAPEEIEEAITKPVENAVSTVSGVKKLSSTSQEGISLVIVEFNWGTNLDAATEDLRERLSTIKSFLPEEANDPMVIKMDIGAMPVLALTIASKRDLAQLKELADNVIVPRIERIKGVGQAMGRKGTGRKGRKKGDATLFRRIFLLNQSLKLTCYVHSSTLSLCVKIIKIKLTKCPIF